MDEIKFSSTLTSVASQKNRQCHPAMLFGDLQVAWTFATLRICSGEVLTAAGS